MTKPEDLGFGPRREVRDFDGSVFVGKTATIRLGHTHEPLNSDQYVHVESIDGEELDWTSPIRASGWAGRYLGDKDTTIRRKIKDVVLIEHMNGGRGSNRTVRTYAEFFNDDQKALVQRIWDGGLMAKLSRHGGDPDRADVIVRFNDFKLDSFAWDFRAPEEWYSELHKGKETFRFDDGFYDTAAEAIADFSTKSSDDLFGTRFFPVLVYPEGEGHKVKDVAGGAKSCSDLIISRGLAIVGTRCKPYEYAGVIEEAYATGGRVARNRQWDWS